MTRGVAGESVDSIGSIDAAGDKRQFVAVESRVAICTIVPCDTAASALHAIEPMESLALSLLSMHSIMSVVSW